ncbi:MAG: O-methyltransferase [Bacteroidia bacterium]
MKRKTLHFFSKYPANSPEHNLSLAFEAFLEQPIYGAQEKHFARIENLRRKLLQDDTIITREDFGAGLSRNLYKRKKTTTVAKLCKGSSMPQNLARLLFQLVYHTNPNICLELGTCLGISGAYLALAQQTAAKNGKLVTLEGDPISADIARNNFRHLHLNNVDVETGCFGDILQDVLVNAGQVDFALIDGHHNGTATIAYYKQIKPFLSGNAVLVFDDIDWSAGMQKAWQTISIFPELYICINLGRTGICIFKKEVLPKQKLDLHI